MDGKFPDGAGVDGSQQGRSWRKINLWLNWSSPAADIGARVGTWLFYRHPVLDKGDISPDDFIMVDIHTDETQSGRRPSAETGLHIFLYRRFPKVGCVLHTHSVRATVLSRAEQGSTLRLSGYEMQKALAGQPDHQDEVAIAVFDNAQDIPALVQRICAAG